MVSRGSATKRVCRHQIIHSHMKKRWNRRFPDRIKLSFLLDQLILAHGRIDTRTPDRDLARPSRGQRPGCCRAHVVHCKFEFGCSCSGVQPDTVMHPGSAGPAELRSVLRTSLIVFLGVLGGAPVRAGGGRWTGVWGVLGRTRGGGGCRRVPPTGVGSSHQSGTPKKRQKRKHEGQGEKGGTQWN